MKSIFFLFCLFFCLQNYAQSNECKCCEKSHEAFDFWIGNWEVTDPEGNLVGRNSIEKVEGNCLIKEVYSSTTNGFTGRSFNFYNQTTGKWEQLWVDNQGTYLHLYGNLVDGAMVLEGQHGNGDEVRTDRITWSQESDGRVKQHWEFRKKDADWVTVFEGYYSRIETP